MGSGRGGLLRAVLRQLGRSPQERAEAWLDDPDPADDLITNSWDFYPEMQPLREAVQARDWAAIRTCLAEFDDANDRAAAGMQVVDEPGIESVLSEAVAADPNDLTALALLGGRTVALGWEIRGGGYGHTVTSDRAQAFHDHLRRADAMFLDVHAAEPGNIDAGIWRITAARALSMGQNEIERRYRLLAAHHPDVWMAQSQALQGFLPKWGGDWKDALFFAVECARNAPKGAPNAALIADYHVEKWLAADQEHRAAYIVQHAVKVELVSAAERSILHPDYRPGLTWVEAHNRFAMALTMARQFKQAAVLYERLEDRVTEFPWAYAGLPFKHYVACRDYTFEQIAS